MKRQIGIGMVLSAMLMILGMSSSLAQGSEYIDDWAISSATTSSAALAPWIIETVDSDTDVGRHVSVAIEPESGMTFISYYDATGKDLYVARYVGSGGDCGPNGAWICEAVDSSGDVGQYNSIAAYRSGDTVRLYISYFDATRGALKYAEGICSSSSCVLDTQTIQIGNPILFSYRGLYTSVKVDSGEVPHIAYQYSRFVMDDALMYAYWVGDDTGNCGVSKVANDWQCETVHTDDSVGRYASLDLDGDDEPTIAFYDADNGYPLVAVYTGSASNRDPGANWYIRRVHQPTLDTGKYVSLSVEDSGLAHIAYHNVTNGTLEYARFVGSGGNCGFSSLTMKWEWQCDEIDDMGTSLTSMGVSLELDDAGYPIIAYMDASETLAPATLNVARRDVVVDLAVVPNCGPEDLFLTWYCDTIDNGGQYTDEAGSVSLAVNSAGLATIGYHELDNYPYPVEGNLKVAYQRLQIFLPLALRNS